MKACRDTVMATAMATQQHAVHDHASDADLLKLCRSVDIDRSGLIDYSEFIASSLSPSVYSSEA